MYLFANNLIYLKILVKNSCQKIRLLMKTIEIDEGMYQLVADDQVIGETEKNNICDALESNKSQKVKLDFLRSSVNYSFYVR